MTAQTARPSATDIIGPYSHWPRKPKARWARPAAFGGTVAVAAVFTHCVVPMIF